MNTKYLSIYPQWHCRNGGGLFLGIRLQFPVTNYDSEAFASNHTYSCLRLTLGLLVFSINVDVKYNYILKILDNDVDTILFDSYDVIKLDEKCISK